MLGNVGHHAPATSKTLFKTAKTLDLVKNSSRTLPGVWYAPISLLGEIKTHLVVSFGVWFYLFEALPLRQTRRDGGATTYLFSKKQKFFQKNGR
jgi:hypothetical protein